MKMFVLYDGRAKSGNLDRASILDTTHSEEEARNTVGFGDAVWYEFDMVGDNLLNPKIRLDLNG